MRENPMPPYFDTETKTSPTLVCGKTVLIDTFHFCVKIFQTAIILYDIAEFIIGIEVYLALMYIGAIRCTINTNEESTSAQKLISFVFISNIRNYPKIEILVVGQHRKYPKIFFYLAPNGLTKRL